MALLMPSTNKNFMALADEAADALFNKGTSLSQAVADIAIREKFTPEETKRLVEKANVVATVRMLRISTDKKATIDLAEYTEVLAKTHPVAEVTGQDPSTAPQETEDSEMQEKTAVLKENRRNAFMDLQDIFKVHGVEKTAGALNKPTSHVALFKKRRELEELKLQKSASEVKIKDAIDYIVSEFSKYNGPSFEKFASEALALHGRKATSVIKSIGNYLKCPVSLEKQAEYIVDDTTKLHKKLAEVCSGLSSLIEKDKNIATLRQDLESSWGSALRAGK